MSLIWIIIAAILLILEFITLDIIAIWYSLAALIAWIISLKSKKFFIQFIVFIVLGLVMQYFLRNKARQFLKEKKLLVSTDNLTGSTGIVTKKINNNDYGEVKVNKKKWTAYADKVLKPNTKIKVVFVDGVKLKVEEF